MWFCVEVGGVSGAGAAAGHLAALDPISLALLAPQVTASGPPQLPAPTWHPHPHPQPPHPPASIPPVTYPMPSGGSFIGQNSYYAYMFLLLFYSINLFTF